MNALSLHCLPEAEQIKRFYNLKYLEHDYLSEDINPIKETKQRISSSATLFGSSSNTFDETFYAPAYRWGIGDKHFKYIIPPKYKFIDRTSRFVFGLYRESRYEFDVELMKNDLLDQIKKTYEGEYNENI